MMKIPKPVVVDFETMGIKRRPFYPPMPVGVSIKYPGKKSYYYAFGHPTKNNCGWGEAQIAVALAYQWKDGVLFQNGKFDVDVAEVWFELPVPKWNKIHDTMFLLFLDDPHQQELALKPAAERLLDWPAEEQDKVAEWLITNQPVPGITISKSKKSPYYFGAYIAWAPGDLVGKYACGDTDRTYELFKYLWPKTRNRRMLAAYDRERELMPILLETERQGLPVNLTKLRADVTTYNLWLRKIDAWIFKKLKLKEPINLNSGKQLMPAMIDAGVVDDSKLLLTPTGQYQTNKEALLVAVKDKQLLAMLKYRAQLNTCLHTFMEPWLVMAENSKGFIFTSWNQVKSPGSDGLIGTRTGRLSSTPNFQNIPKVFDAIWYHEDRKAGLPKCPLKGLPRLPIIRGYIQPFKGHILLDRDYSQQEPRILAHFDGGALMQKYLDNPWIDFHDYAKLELEKVGKFYDRRPVKNTNLGLIYGMGAATLAERNAMTVNESRSLKKSVEALYPGLKAMYKDMKVRARSNQPIRTWGGREYFCEPAKIVKGRMREFDYKMVNVLIQGSAADCTKEAIIRFYYAKKPTWKILLNVHDQITISVPIKDLHEAMEVLRECMESIEFDVAMLSEGTTSLTNWYELKPYDEKGVRVC